MLRVNLNHLTVISDGARLVTETGFNKAPIVISLCILRINLNYTVKISNSTLIVAEEMFCIASSVIYVCILRVNLNRTVVISDGTSFVLLLVFGIALFKPLAGGLRVCCKAEQQCDGDEVFFDVHFLSQ